MATSLQNLLSNQFSTQLGSLSAPVDPGAALANIIGGVGKTYTLGEQLKLAEQQDQAEIMRMQQAKEQERMAQMKQLEQQQQFQAAQNQLNNQAAMERSLASNIGDIQRAGVDVTGQEARKVGDVTREAVRGYQEGIPAQQEAGDLGGGVVGMEGQTQWSNEPIPVGGTGSLATKIQEAKKKKAKEGLWLSGYQSKIDGLTKKSNAATEAIFGLESVQDQLFKPGAEKEWTQGSVLKSYLDTAKKEFSQIIGFPISGNLSEAITNRAIFNKFRTEVALTQVGKTKGSVSNKEMDLFISTAIELGDDIKGARYKYFMINGLSELARLGAQFSKNRLDPYDPETAKSEIEWDELIASTPKINTKVESPLTGKPVTFGEFMLRYRMKVNEMFGGK